jgi:endoglucanase
MKQAKKIQERLASVQEETTFLGAATSAWGLQPDVAIAIDVTFGEQNGVSNGTVGMGKGPAIGMANLTPSHRGDGGHGKKLEMPYQMEPTPPFRHGRLAGQVAREAFPRSAQHSAALHAHTVETITSDERTGRPMAEFIASLTKMLDKLTYAVD